MFEVDDRQSDGKGAPYNSLSYKHRPWIDQRESRSQYHGINGNEWWMKEFVPEAELFVNEGLWRIHVVSLLRTWTDRRGRWEGYFVYRYLLFIIFVCCFNPTHHRERHRLERNRLSTVVTNTPWQERQEYDWRRPKDRIDSGGAISPILYGVHCVHYNRMSILSLSLWRHQNTEKLFGACWLRESRRRTRKLKPWKSDSWSLKIKSGK